MFLEGTMNEFSYGQALLFYKDDIEEIEKKSKMKIIFEQDGATAHKSKTNIFLIKCFIQKWWVDSKSTKFS